MTYSELLDYCLSKNGAYVDHPFGPESDIIKIEGKIFAQLFLLGGRESVTLNCERMTGDFYRQLFPGIVVRGYHCPPVQQPYFNTFPLAEVPDEMILEMLDHSYTTVVGKLPKYKQKKLLDGAVE
jgi:predicted DNA-binding protein (MmcQ/YjbR family)